MTYTSAPFGPTLLSLLVLGTAGCHGKDTTPTTAVPVVSVVDAHYTSIPLTVELPGRTGPYLVAQVRARVSGIVQDRLFKEGTDVAADQALFRIDPAPYRAALSSARAQLGRARANVEATSAQAQRDEILVSANAVSRQKYINAVAAQRQALADVEAARAAEEIASINLGYTQVTSPIAGRIGAALVTQGAYVQAEAATLMATVQQIDPIYVDLTQTSIEGLELRKRLANGELTSGDEQGPAVRLILEDNSEYPENGTLEFTDITVDPGTGSVGVRAIFRNPLHLLLPGMFVRARIDQGSVRAVLVPQESVSHDRNGKATVLTVNSDSKVEIRQVIATRVFGEHWVVESGLSDGDRVIVSGLQHAPPGTLVQAHVLPMSPPKLVAASAH